MAAWTIFVGILGFLAVLQNGLNKKIGFQWGLAPAILFNGAVLTTFAIIFLGIVHFWPHTVPQTFRVRSVTAWQWWYVLPGLFGLSIVLGLPFAMGKIGAIKAFLILVVAQALGSFLWDAMIEKITISPIQITGAILALIGVGLTTFGR